MTVEQIPLYVSNWASVQSWMSLHKLKLNSDETEDKTEFLLIGNEQQRSKYLSMIPIELSSVKTNPAKSAWNLGSNIWKKIYFPLTYISSLQLMLLPYAKSVAYYPVSLIWIVQKLLATALVSSHLMYCNSLLYSSTDTDLTKLQRVQNWVACIRTKSPPLTSSVRLLCSLHCLPVTFRILLKISLLTYKTLHESQFAIFTPCLLHHSHHIHWDQTKELVCPCLGSRPT